ncbi:hypothetical protein EDB82DRAFT_233864 [Fusarium venenatum]|uniref:uncharacterized protein n=1 Tax=Fusarium venenatum TaxID=56646 RepID=UPI001D1BF047|nr:hypothetical protein EDB82DRAFT_233864 [Fusarium venenatum]
MINGYCSKAFFMSLLYLDFRSCQARNREGLGSSSGEKIMGETERNIDRSSTVVGRAPVPAASNQTKGMRDRASCALCFNLGMVASPSLLAGLYVLISRISARSAKSRKKSRLQTRRSNYTAKERHLIDEAHGRDATVCYSLGRGYLPHTPDPLPTSI